MIVPVHSAGETVYCRVDAATRIWLTTDGAETAPEPGSGLLPSSVFRALSCSAPIALAVGQPLHGQESLLSPGASDPRVMGPTHGAPVPPEAGLIVAAGDVFDVPHSRWMARHIRDPFPAVEASGGLEPVMPPDDMAPPVAATIRAGTDVPSFMPTERDAEMTWTASLGASCTDGMLIIHEGRAIHEWHSVA